MTADLNYILVKADDLRTVATSYHKDIDKQKTVINRLNMQLLSEARRGSFSTKILISDLIPAELLDRTNDMYEEIIQFYKNLIISLLKDKGYIVFTPSKTDLTLSVRWTVF